MPRMPSAGEPAATCTERGRRPSGVVRGPGAPGLASLRTRVRTACVATREETGCACSGSTPASPAAAWAWSRAPSAGRCSLVDVNVLRTSADLPVAQRLVTIEKGIDAWLDEYAPDAVAVERVFARSDSSTIMGTAQASGIALVAAARRGLPVATAHPERGEGRGLRQRPRRQGPGRRDGDPDPAARRARPSRPTPPTRWRWPSPTSGAAAPRPGSTPPSPRRGAGR